MATQNRDLPVNKRDSRGFKRTTEDPRKQSRGVSMRVPGDGSVTLQPGEVDNRSAGLEGDKMQAFVGGGKAKEHEYMSNKNGR